LRAFCTGIAAGRVLDEKLHLAAEDPAFGVDLVDRVLAAGQLVLAHCCVSPGQRIIQADLDHLLGPCLDDERGGDLRGAYRCRCLDDRTAAYLG
jgi:hypothetical protein